MFLTRTILAKEKAFPERKLRNLNKCYVFKSLSLSLSLSSLLIINEKFIN